MKKLFFFLVLVSVSGIINAQLAQPYQSPPKEILDLVDIQPTPMVRVSSKGSYMVLLERYVFKTLEELSEEELRLAGLRINPRNFGPSRANYAHSLRIMNMNTGKAITVNGAPSNARIGSLSISRDEKYAAFTNTTAERIELWIMELVSGKCTLLTSGLAVNAVLGSPYSWSSDNKGLYCKLVTDQVPLSSIYRKPLPEGPVVQVSGGKKAPVRTFQDLLRNKNDEKLFESFAASELVYFGVDGSRRKFASRGMYYSADESPDGKFVLLTSIQYPFSYIVQLDRFPVSYAVHEASGKFLNEFYRKPLIEELPNGFDAVETGKRDIEWRNDQNATLVWVEAQDGGDPAKEVAIRDHVYQVEAPFTGAPQLLATTELRFSGLSFGNASMMLVRENWWKSRRTKTTMVDPTSKSKPKVIFDRSEEDVYNDPGNFLMDYNENGHYVLRTSKDKKKLYLSGQGYSPAGNRPFLDEYTIADGKRKRLWQADGKTTYENIATVFDPEKQIMLTTVESPEMNPNFYLRSGKSAKKITNFPNPYASFMGVTKQRIFYKRKDGVDLSATLYLPKGYDKVKDGPLPVVMWAYPREFKDKAQAGQVKESPHRFAQINYGSPVYWAMRGYAILDNTDFPIVGEGKTEPNDSFIEQLVANAEAAINTLAEMGVGDRKRVAIGGHSYGAFMTANRMAHCDLFAAGIARSGAYNRTLTPFGFQAEERTFWEAKKVYMEMSPFYFAEKINEPLLLIHGDADNNPGTFTLQSERLFAAIKGLGGTARLVLLPYESHGYSARENILHMLWEQDQWREAYVKNKK